MLEFLKRTLKVEGEEESLPKEDEDATKAEDGKTRENKFKKQAHLRTEYNRRRKKSDTLPSVQLRRSAMFDSATPWTAARQASLSISNSWSLLKLMSTESVMPSNHLILCRPLLLPPSISPSIGVFSNESVP